MPFTPHDLGLHKLLKLLSPAVRPVLNRATNKRLKNAVNIADLRACAETRLHKMCFGYLDSGGDDEVTLRRNHDAYSQIEMHFQVRTSLIHYQFLHDGVEGVGRVGATPGLEHHNIRTPGVATLLCLPHCRQQNVPHRRRGSCSTRSCSP